MTQKGWAAVVVIIIIAVIVGGVGFFYYQNSSLKNKDRLAAILNDQVYNLQKQINNLKSFREEGKKISVLEDDYESAQFMFSVKIWPAIEIVEYKYDPQKVTSGILATYSLPASSSIKTAVNNRWTLDIWNKSADNKSVAQDFSNLKLEKETKIKIGNKDGTQLIFFGPNQISGSAIQKYSLFIVRTGNFVYAISSKYCDQSISAECKQILENFKFN